MNLWAIRKIIERFPPRTLLQAAAGDPPGDLHRHAAPRQPGRSGPARAPRLAAHSAARPAPGVARPVDRPQHSRTIFNERFRKGLPTSIDELEWQSPILMRLDELGVVPTVTAHSIIADQHDPPRAGGYDGVVRYESAHRRSSGVGAARVFGPPVPGQARGDRRGPAHPAGAPGSLSGAAEVFVVGTTHPETVKPHVRCTENFRRFHFRQARKPDLREAFERAVREGSPSGTDFSPCPPS